jgi:hypothetical protein
MRRVLLLVLVTALAFPAGAAKRVSLEQLEQTLAADSAVHRDDAQVALQIGDLELNEQLTRATLERFTAQIASTAGRSIGLP